jgi:hypothetical protein
VLLAVLRNTVLTFESYYNNTINYNEAELPSLTAYYYSCCESLNVAGELVLFLSYLRKNINCRPL